MRALAIMSKEQWTTDFLAEDLDGNEVEYNSDQACRWCATGWLLREAVEMGGWNQAGSLYARMVEAAGKFILSNYPGFEKKIFPEFGDLNIVNDSERLLSCWNDQPVRTHGEVCELLQAVRDDCQ